MADVWSFNTTVRDPDRMENFLRALSEMEGDTFDEDGQEKFFGLQIQKRLFKPTRRTLVEDDLIEAVHNKDTTDDIPDGFVNRILDKYRGAVNAAGRGRTSAGILNRFGLCVALASKGAVVITELGQKWLDGKITDEELFTKFFLKWQYPNPIESGYSDFNIRPFLGVLKFISIVNDRWVKEGYKAVGITKDEYLLFLPALTNINQIEIYANELIKYRKKLRALNGMEKANYKKKFSLERAATIYGPDSDLQKDLRNLRDYMDSSINYFRMSGFISVRGDGGYVDIARDKSIQARSIVQSFSPEAISFQTYEEYLAYICDVKKPVLPWENETELKEISQNLTQIAQSESLNSDLESYTETKIKTLSNKETRERVEELHILVNEIRIQKLRNLRYNTNELKGYIDKLKSLTSRNYETVTARPSLDFEWFTSLALMVLNDAVKITPSYKLGDDGIPTGFAANISDIECYYQSFGLIVEVTLRNGLDQWIRESQPVMRHFRDFENKSDMKDKYCLFVAPFIHRDTINTFWYSIKNEFEGQKQKIIPLSLAQFIEVLKIVCIKIENGRFDHRDLKNLLKSIVDTSTQYSSSTDWLTTISQQIGAWA